MILGPWKVSGGLDLLLDLKELTAQGCVPQHLCRVTISLSF